MKYPCMDVRTLVMWLKRRGGCPGWTEAKRGEWGSLKSHLTSRWIGPRLPKVNFTVDGRCNFSFRSPAMTFESDQEWQNNEFKPLPPQSLVPTSTSKSIFVAAPARAVLASSIQVSDLHPPLLSILLLVYVFKWVLPTFLWDKTKALASIFQL